MGQTTKARPDVGMAYPAEATSDKGAGWIVFAGIMFLIAVHLGHRRGVGLAFLRRGEHVHSQT
jgi:hypothetical protein